MENLPNGQLNTNTNGVGENEIDLEFLPYIYEIIKSIEREPTLDTTQKPRDSQDTSVKVLELEKKLNQAREQINQLPGIEHSQEEQLRQIENLRKQLSLKRQLLSKIFFSRIGNNEQLINRLAESAPIRQAAKMLVYFYNRTKAIAQDEGIKKMENTKLIDSLKKIRDELERKSKQL